MLLHQYLSKDKESIQYSIENLTPQRLFCSIYRKKVVLLGAAPVERLTEPQLLQPGETLKLQKPDIKLPWKRYIAFAASDDLLVPAPTDREFSALLSIWVDELNKVVLTESLCEDGVRAVKVSSWVAWAARKKAAPAAHKYQQAKESFIADMNSKLIAGLEPHMHATEVARVRVGPELGSEELQFMSLRSRKVREGIHKLTGLDLSSLPSDHTPRIQICASGGGYRAMVATLGSLIGLEDSGLLDTVTAMSGLSGSTWAMAAWYSGGKSLQETREIIAAKLACPFYTTSLWPEVVQEHVRERTGFGQELGLVDVMGWHLHNHLLKDLPCKQELWLKPRLSEQALALSGGSKPLPIYTAVAHEHRRFRWAEFTPYEVGIAQDVNAWIPTFSFGRKFSGGVSTDFAVEPSLALLQATWGSAFCATVDQMMHELDNGDGAEPAKLQQLLHTLIYDHLEMGDERLITPAKFANPALGLEQLKEHPFKEMKTLKLMDAGVHTNLPLPPLLRKERGSDIIICHTTRAHVGSSSSSASIGPQLHRVSSLPSPHRVCVCVCAVGLDQSSAPDIYSSVSVSIAAQFAASEGMPFPDCAAALAVDAALAGTPKAKHSAANTRRVTVIPGDVAKGVPTIIYMPLLRNDAYSPSFCPRENALSKGGYCSTFNFQYTADQVMELSGLTHANMLEAAGEITQCIKDVTIAKMKLASTNGQA